MRSNMHLFFSSLAILVSLLPHETFADTTDSGVCQRRCGGDTVPYPFGFSAGCPITLSCDADALVSLLPYGGGDNGTSYRVISFNSTISTVVLALPSSCSRSVPDARRALSGGNYGVSSRTGLFLRGGCHESNSSVCSVPAAVMSMLLRTAQCGVNATDSAANDVLCVVSAASNATSPRIFLQWEQAESTKCDDVLTSAMFADTQEGTVSQEFGLAELGWWLNGTCTGGGEPCTVNATCSNVQTPDGSVGHRCSCVAGMDGDGFLAGDGCYVVGRYGASRSMYIKVLPLVAGLFGAFLLCSLGILAVYLIRQRKKHNAMTKTTKQLLGKAGTFFRGELVEDELEQGAGGPRRFSYRELTSVTDNFSNDRAGRSSSPR